MNKKSGFFFFSNAIQFVLRFLQMIVITRNLSGVDLGLYYVSAAYPQLLSRVFDLGLPHATRFYLLKFPNQALFLCKLIGAFSVAIFPFIACIFLFLDYLPLEVEEIARQVSEDWVILSFYCLLLILNSIFNALIISIEKYKTLLLTSTIPYFIFIMVILYDANQGTLSVHYVLLQLLISEAIILLLCLTPIISFIRHAGIATRREFRWKDVVVYSLKIYPNGLLKTMTTRLDRIVLSFIATPVFIGQYSVLVTLRDIATIPVTTYGQTFMNELLNRIKLAKGGIKKLVDTNLIWILCIYASGFFVFLIVQDYFLKLFFDDLEGTKIYTMSLMLVVSAVPNVLLAFIHYFFLVVNKPQYVSLSSGVAICCFYGFIVLTYGQIGSDSFFYASIVAPLVGFIYLFLYYRVILKKLDS